MRLLVFALSLLLSPPLVHGAATTPPEPARDLGPDAPEESITPLDLIMAKHLGEAACEDPGSEHMASHPALGAQLAVTARLYAIPCTADGTNVSYRLYWHETGEIGGIETLYFAAYSEQKGWSGTDLLYDIEVDGPKLKAIVKASAADECAGEAEWTWIDYGYRLDRLALRAPCAGGGPTRAVYPPPLR